MSFVLNTFISDIYIYIYDCASIIFEFTTQLRTEIIIVILLDMYDMYVKNTINMILIWCTTI